MRLTNTEKTMVAAMARAMFVSAWADRQEERGRTYPGQDLMDVAPKTPRYAYERALMLAGKLGNLHNIANLAAYSDLLESRGLKIEAFKPRPTWPGIDEDIESTLTDEYLSGLGHYLAMQSLGQGVSWFDNHAEFLVNIPNFEFHLA